MKERCNIPGTSLGPSEKADERNTSKRKHISNQPLKRTQDGVPAAGGSGPQGLSPNDGGILGEADAEGNREPEWVRPDVWAAAAG